MRGHAGHWLTVTVVAGVMAAAAAQAASIINSSHDMSFGSATTGLKASNAADNQTCKFCHAPHRTAKNVPLWNREEVSQTYTFYTSNYLNNNLSVAVPTQADMNGTRTKMCLSCHDGMTAVGAAFDINPGVIATSPSNNITGARNLSTNLADDHPVLYSVDPGADPNIQLPPGGDPVQVYGASNQVECTSCHDPHDNQYGSFLVKDNFDAAICKTCHIKSGFSSSIHDTSSVSYTPPSTGLPTTVGEWSCRNCHTAHNAGGTGAYLLQGAEEATCTACHGPSGPATDDLGTTITRASSHPIVSGSNIHLNPENDATNLGNGTRHAECQDCHNPHKVQAGVSSAKTVPDNLIVSVLLGAWGVTPTYGAAWTLATWSAPKEFTDTAADKEYELCFKCHSSYAFGASPPVGYTDVAREFNPANNSWHPVIQAGNNPYCTSTATNGNVVTMEPPYNQNPNEHNTISCSDCHRSSVAGDPLGPHGSAATYVLRASLITDTNNATGNVATPLCVQCHKADTYNSTSNGSRYSEHGRGNHLRADGGVNDPGGCRTCHGNSNVRGTFHGSNDTWPSGPALRFLNAPHFLTDWRVATAGEAPDLGYCWTQTCRNHNQQNY